MNAAGRDPCGRGRLSATRVGATRVGAGAGDGGSCGRLPLDEHGFWRL